MLKSYGGYTWSNKDPEQLNPDRKRIIASLGLGAVGISALYAGTRDLPNGYRPVDYFASGARFVSNLTPLQLANTLRIPEAVSPFMSPKYREIGGVNVNRWGREFLTSDSSYDWLKYITGLDHGELAARGVTRGMPSGGASALEFVPTGGISGRLESIVGSQRHVLNENISMLSLGEEIARPGDKPKLNRFAAGVLAAADMWKNTGFEEHTLFQKPAHRLGEELIHAAETAHYLPIPSPVGPVNSLKALERTSTYWRGIPAFEMGRFNVLLKGVAEGLGEPGRKIFSAIGGGIRPGPASAQFARYGGLAAVGGMALIANEQLDWFRRQGLGGQVASSAIIASGLSYGVSRLGMTGRQAALAGVASFAAQVLLPGFNQGLIQGIATQGVNLDVARGSALNPFNYYRRAVEGYFPSISDYKTGAFLGVLAMGSMIRLPGMAQNLNVSIARKLGDPLINEIIDQNQSARDMFYEQLGRNQYKPIEETIGFGNRAKLLVAHRAKSGNHVELNHELNTFWSQAENRYKVLRADNKLNTRLIERLRTIDQSHTGLEKQLRGLGTELWHNFLGADLSEAPKLLEESRLLGFKATSRLGRFGSVFAAALLGHQLLTGGLLGSMESSSQLADIYSGKELVEVKKGRMWEMGGSEYEGGESSYFRPHAYALMMNQVRTQGVWGEDISPVSAWFKKNFTYDLELQNYWTRPYTITNAAFSDVPVIGGILGGSIGGLFKAPKLMHVNEWVHERGGEVEQAHIFKGGFVEPAYSLGAVGEGNVVSPFSPQVLHANLRSQFTELEGLPGWISETIMGGLAGSANWATDQARMATSGEMTSWNKSFQESQLGGLLFSNEFVRRLLPHQSSEVKSYNPLINSMPSWLPDKFHYGDPYTSVEWGEARMPGSGFAALHPELKGVDPEAYPLLYKYQILADLAPLTPEFFKIQNQVYTMRQGNQLTASDAEWIDRVDERRRKQVNKFSYEDNQNALYLPGSGITRGIWNAGLRGLRALSAPAEYLSPMGFRPVQKLMSGGKTEIERYESERLYGTTLAFWDKPWRDWFRPALYSTAHLMGYSGVPEWKREADSTAQYFDQLQFVKYMNLMKQAEAQGDPQAVAQYQWQASQTRAGISSEAAPLSMYWTLPGEDRPYFNSFVQAAPGDRNRILEMIPQDQRPLYQSLWARMDAGDPSLYSTGGKSDPQLMEAKYQNVVKSMGSQPMPRPDWIGWNQDVDLDDIKARYVERIGADIHDYGLWESGIRKSEGQPFLEGSEDFMFQGPGFSSIRGEIHNMLGLGQINYSTMPGVNPRAHIIFNDRRDAEVQSHLQRYLNG